MPRAGSRDFSQLANYTDAFRPGAGRYDVAFRLQANHWNGTVAPQLVVRRLFAAASGYETVAHEPLDAE